MQVKHCIIKLKLVVQNKQIHVQNNENHFNANFLRVSAILNKIIKFSKSFNAFWYIGKRQSPHTNLVKISAKLPKFLLIKCHVAY